MASKSLQVRLERGAPALLPGTCFASVAHAQPDITGNLVGDARGSAASSALPDPDCGRTIDDVAMIARRMAPRSIRVMAPHDS